MAEIDADAEWLTVNEVARHYRVSARTISRWAVSGEIRSKRIGPSGRLVRIHRSALDTGHETLSAVA
ncbi:helix-turn-helix domain-containing protein [Streptomyces fimicarius]|uniref:helix-turn-helix domain-containing protein n=1 Tax=Streptomyces TaxID=1883 RepID=UPI0036CFDF64